METSETRTKKKQKQTRRNKSTDQVTDINWNIVFRGVKKIFKWILNIVTTKIARTTEYNMYEGSKIEEALNVIGLCVHREKKKKREKSAI